MCSHPGEGKLSFGRNLYRAYFRILRTIPWTRNFTTRIQSGPLQGYRFAVAPGNPFIFGTYELDSLTSVLSQLDGKAVVFDLGAHVGYYSMALATKQGVQVYAFEPFPTNRALLERHLTLNHVENVEVLPYAVAAEEGTVEFSNIENPTGNTYVTQSAHFQMSQEVISVPKVSIDHLVIEKGRLRSPDLIKIDVEGAEHDVLLGARQTIEQFRPIILLATHDFHLKGVKDQCLEFLRSRDYQVTPTDEGKSLPGLDDFVATPSEMKVVL